MKLRLPDKLRQMFNKGGIDSLVGIALHGKVVRLIKGDLLGSTCRLAVHDQVPVETEDQWPAVIEALIESHKLQNSRCTLVLPSNRYQLLQIDKPSLEEEELAASLAWTVKDLVNVPPEELVADYFHVPPIPMQGPKINVIASSSKTVQPLVDIFTRHKIELFGIVPEEMVMRNVVGYTETGCLLLCQQINEEPNLQIVKKDQVYFARRLRGFARLHDYTAQELVEGMTDSLSLEIQRSMDYYESQLKQAPVKEILLALPTEHQLLIAEQINAHFHVDVKVMDVNSDFADMSEVKQRKENGEEDEKNPFNEQYYPAVAGVLEPLAAVQVYADE